MPAEIVDAPPPILPGRGYKGRPELLEAGELAKANPGKWVKVGIRMSSSAAYSIKNGTSCLKGGFDAASRDRKKIGDEKKTTMDVYIRYVGEGK